MRTWKYLIGVACLLLSTVAVHAQDDVAKLADALGASDVKIQIEACHDLAKLGVKAGPAVPQLIKALKADDAELQRCAALALAAIGDGARAAVPALTEALGSEQATTRAYAAHALGRIGSSASSSLPALVAAFTDEDPTVRRAVRDAIRALKPPKEVSLPLFVKMLNTATPADAAAAVQTLAELGADALPALLNALEDKDACYWACLALSEIGPAAAPAVEKLGKVLDHQDPEVRMEALVALAAIGPAAKGAVGRISAVLDNDDAEAVRYAAAFALGSIGEKEAALPSLAKALQSDDEFLRVAGAWALVRLIDQPSDLLDKAVKIITGAVTSEDHRVRDMAMRAFTDPDLSEASLGPAFRTVLEGLEDPQQLMEIVDSLSSLGPKVVPLCIRSLEEKRPLRFYAMQVLIKIGPAAAPAVPALAATLEDKDATLRREALFTLGAIGPESASATSQIAKELADSEQDVRHAACYALGKIGPGAKAALPALRTAMKTDDDFMQIATVWAALKITPQDKELGKLAVPRLIRGLDSELEQVRIECAYELGELGEVAKSAVPALKKAAGDDSAAVRAAAAKSLEALK